VERFWDFKLCRNLTRLIFSKDEGDIFGNRFGLFGGAGRATVFCGLDSMSSWYVDFLSGLRSPCL
jgi:hypothetical protein